MGFEGCGVVFVQVDGLNCMYRCGLLLALMASCLALLTTIPSRVCAEEVHFSTRSWLVDRGLPDNFVNQVVQDKRGFLWVGTAAGLARFDSVSFKDYRDAQTSADFVSNIRDLAVTPDGSLLTVPASGGVVEWKDGNASVHPITSVLGDLTALDLYVEPGGAIWVGGDPGSLIRWANGVVTRFGLSDGINRRVNRISFATDSRGRTWVASGEFLGWHHEGKLVPIDQPMSEIGTALLVAPARTGGVWIASAERLLRLENDRAISRCEAPQWPAKRAGIQCLFEDSSGRLWIGTRREGLYIYETGELKKVALDARAIQSVIEDSEGNIWVATLGEGLCRLRPQSVTILNTRSGLLEDTSTSVCGDPSGALWCANRSGGLARYKDGVVQHFGAVPGGGWLFASRVAPDRQGNIWMGSNNGIYRLPSNRPEQLELMQPPMRGVHILHGSRAGDMWVTSSLGLGFFHEGVYQNVVSPAEGMSFRVDALAENSQGRIWIATSELHEVKRQIRFFEYSAGRLNEQLSSEEWASGPIHTLFFDHSDSLWIGAAGGLVLKRGSKFTRFTKAHGLPDDVVSQIQEDATGYLWIAGRQALFRVKISNLLEIADGKASRVEAALFGEDDGLQPVFAPSGGQPRTWETPDGRLWFTLYKGVIGVDPAAVIGPRASPPLYIDEVTLDQRAFPVVKSQLHIPPGVQQIKIRVAVLDFSHPEHVVLRYRLEGIDRGWVDADEDRTARYSHLPPGDFVLTIQAANQNGVWVEKETTLLIHVAAAWWQSRWFLVVAAVVVAAVIASAARVWAVRNLKVRLQRLEKEHALERERARIARNLHDELGGSLTQIGLLAERLKRHRNMEEIEKTLSLLIRRTQGLATDLESIVWTVSPQNNSWDRLAAFIARYARLFFNGTGIECRLEGAEVVPPLPLAIEVQHEVLAVCKEALNNVLKHSKATVVTLRLSIAAGVFELVIQDNGVGFEPTLKEHSERNGLTNMRTRSAELKGQLEIKSSPGTGASLRLLIPLSGGTEQSDGNII